MTNGSESPSAEQVETLLKELGMRGFDSVKQLVDQEFLAKSNLGLLTASRILVSGENVAYLLPNGENGGSGAVLVPMDPFECRLSQLRKSVIPGGSSARPDILVIGFRELGGKLFIKLTPVEAKCYESELNISQCRQFLRNQCAPFINFLNIFLKPKVTEDYHGWDLARRMVLADWLEYGIHCQPPAGNSSDKSAETEKLHRLVGAIIRGNFETEIDEIGRLVIVDGSQSPRFRRHNEEPKASSLLETLRIPRKNAFGLLTKWDWPDEIERQMEDHWDLLPSPPSDPQPTQVPQPVAPSETQTETNAPSDDSDARTEPEDQGTDEGLVESGAQETPNVVTSDHDTPPAEQDAQQEDPQIPPAVYPKILLGKSDRDNDIFWQPFGEDGDRLLGNAHAYIAGSCGYGKSYLLEKVVGSSIISSGVVPLFFDFVGDMQTQGYQTINASNGFAINPLRLSNKNNEMPIAQVYQLADILRKALKLGDQQHSSTIEAMKKAFEDRGIDTGTPLNDESRRWPNFRDFQEQVEASRDDKLLGRLRPLFDWNIFKGSEDDFSSFLNEPTVINFQALRQAGDKLANTVSQILLKGIFNYLIAYRETSGVKYIIIIDEAHRIASLQQSKRCSAK